MLSPQQLRELLDRERERADRSGRTLSYISFSFEERPARKADFEPVLHILRRRLRILDAMGWLDEKRLGVVLPYTPHQGAATVANDVMQSLPASAVLPRFDIYCYPHAARDPEGMDGVAEPVVPVAEPASVQPLEMLLVRSLPPWKRMLDIVGAVVAIILLTPFMLLIALAVRFTSPGPVIYRQLRSGLGGRPFIMYKFRTMRNNAHKERLVLAEQNEQDGPAFKIKNDPRVTSIGRFLRRTSIDELPQLWNVLLGDMSLVGPRPLPCEEAGECRGWQRRRMDVTPGITCIWQVEGRSSVSFDEWVRMDVRYISSRTLPHDLKLLLQTLPAVLQGKGAS